MSDKKILSLAMSSHYLMVTIQENDSYYV
jgi:hypothetical protein